jgi:hypothetical protein
VALDYGYGSTYHLQPQEQSRWSGSFTCLARTREEATAAAHFFFHRKGRLGPFYCPTWQRDVEVVSGLTTGSTSLTVHGTTAHTLFSQSLSYRNLAFVTRQGFTPIGIFRTEVVGDNTVLTLDAPLPSGAEMVRFVSWLLMARFATDQFAVVWKTDQVAEFDFSITSLLDRFFELQIAGDRITFGGDYVVMPPHSPEPVFIPMEITGEKLLIGGDYFG